MENDSLKSAWKRMATEDKSSQELKSIIRERGHSLTKKIRRQLFIEAISFAAFLVVYYDFFDGDQKPLSANIFLVTAWLLVIIHNILGFLQLKSSNRGDNIEELLGNRLYKMKLYAAMAGILRILAAASFLLFFVSVITFTQVNYWILSAIIFIFLIQMVVFLNIWKRRIARMKEIVSSLRAG